MKLQRLRGRKSAWLSAVLSILWTVPVNADASSLQLCGSGKLKAYGIFTVGEGYLYRPDCRADWSVSVPEPRYMEFRYERDIPAEAFRESALNYLKQNGIHESAALTAFHAGYQDIEKGDVYAIYYAPGAGLELRLNETILSRLADEALSLAYFSIWLGENPFDNHLKNSLLGDN
jgi:hypothetical protein